MLAETTIVKDVRSLEHLVDKTALFLHRVEADLRPATRQMLHQGQQADPELAGKKVLIVDDDLRNIFALTSKLERWEMVVLRAENGRQALELLRRTPGRRPGAHGHHDARDGRLRDDAGDPERSTGSGPADHRPDGQGDEGGPPEVHRGRGVGLPGQAGQQRAAPVDAPRLAAPPRRIGHAGSLSRGGPRRVVRRDRARVARVRPPGGP